MAKISVPQQDGEIGIVRNGDLDDPTVYPVSAGVVEVKDENVAHFLAVVDGAELVDAGKPATEKPEKPKADASA